MSKKRVLVTGGAGFIGSNFCNLNKDTYEMIALDNLLLGDRENLDVGVEFIEGDARKVEDLEKVGGDLFAVLHLAGTSSAPMFGGEGLVEGYVNSVESFLQSLEYARKAGAKKFLYASTSSLYANNPTPLVETQVVTPPNHYAVTKMCYEEAARCYVQVHPEMDVVGFRFMSVYGPNEEAKGRYANIISQFLWDLSRGVAPVVYGDGSQTRDFTNVEDIVAGIVLALEHKERLGARVYNIGTGNAVSFNAILKELIAGLGTDVQPEYIKNPVTEVYVQDQCADITRIRQELGYEPRVDLHTGILQQIAQLRPERIRETSSDLLR